MDNEKPEIECNGWVIYSPSGKPQKLTFTTSAELCWEGFIEKCGIEDVQEGIVAAISEGFTVRPVCFVSPDQKYFLNKMNSGEFKVALERLTEECAPMRSETLDEESR